MDPALFAGRAVMVWPDDTPAPAPQPIPSRVGMWDDERRRPLLYAALYGAAFAASLLLSHAYAAGWLPW